MADIITYDIANYPESQVGSGEHYIGTATVSGTITIDTGAAALTAAGIAIPYSDITAGNFEIQAFGSDGGPSSARPQDYMGTLLLSLSSGQGLIASTTQLYIEPSDSYSDLDLVNGSGFLYWTTASSDYQGYDPAGYTIFQQTAPAVASQPGDAIGTSPMVIAIATPEPASVVLLAVGTAALWLAARRRGG